MASPYLGEIMLAGFKYAPNGWALCQGQTLSIATFAALASLLGNAYGGDGKTTFGLPNLQGQVPIAIGQFPGSANNYVLGQNGGAPSVTLAASQIPPHNHLVNVGGLPDRGQQPATSPANNYFGGNAGAQYYAAPSNLNASLSSGSISPVTGAITAHDNMMPFLALNWCICLQGIYPQHS